MANNLLTTTYTVTDIGRTVFLLQFSQFPGTFTFSVLVTSGANYTLLTAIAGDGTLIPDGIFNNYTQSAQGRAEGVGGFAIDVISLGTSGEIKIEIKVK